MFFFLSWGWDGFPALFPLPIYNAPSFKEEEVGEGLVGARGLDKDGLQLEPWVFFLASHTMHGDFFQGVVPLVSIPLVDIHSFPRGRSRERGVGQRPPGIFRVMSCCWQGFDFEDKGLVFAALVFMFVKGDIYVWSLRRPICLSTYSWRRENPCFFGGRSRVSSMGCLFAKAFPHAPNNADGML